ncbi:MAG: EF-hand domain-containing protein [Hyphomicrobiales bacterium]
MQKKTKLALVASVLGLATLGAAAGLALADRGHGHGGRGHGSMMMMHMTERYDADRDGKVSQSEIDANRTAWHGEFDGDKNGNLSLTEFQSLWLKARREEMVREFQRFDRDGDGQVTLDEYKAPMAGMAAQMDRDGDGMMGPGDRPGKRRHHMPQAEGEAAPQ